MLPFHPTFRRLMSRFVPQLSKEDLDRHESLIALRQQVRRELPFVIIGKLQDIISLLPAVCTQLKQASSKLKKVSSRLKHSGSKATCHKLQGLYDPLQAEYGQLDVRAQALYNQLKGSVSNSQMQVIKSTLINIISELADRNSQLRGLNSQLKVIAPKDPELQALYDQLQALYDQLQTLYIVDHEEDAARQAVEILKPVEREFRSVHRLYVAGRRLAISQGRYLQIPTSFTDFGKFVWFNLAFRWQQVANFFITLPKRIEYWTQKQQLLRWPAAAVSAGVLAITTIGFNSLYKAIEIPAVPVLILPMESEEPRPGQFTADVALGVNVQEPFEARLEITPVEVRTNVNHELDSAVVRIRVKLTENHASARESKVAIDACEKCDSIDLVDAKIKPGSGSGKYSNIIVGTCKVNAQLPPATRPWAGPKGTFKKISTSRNVFTGSATVVYETEMTMTPIPKVLQSVK